MPFFGVISGLTLVVPRLVRVSEAFFDSRYPSGARYAS